MRHRERTGMKHRWPRCRSSSPGAAGCKQKPTFLGSDQLLVDTSSVSLGALSGQGDWFCMLDRVEQGPFLPRTSKIFAKIMPAQPTNTSLLSCDRLSAERLTFRCQSMKGQQQLEAVQGAIVSPNVGLSQQTLSTWRYCLSDTFPHNLYQLRVATSER